MNKSRINRQSQFLCRTGVVAAIAVICCVLWGSAFPCIKIGYRMFEIGAGDIGSQILFAGIRFTLAGLFTIAFYGFMLQAKKAQGAGETGADIRCILPEKSSWQRIFKLSLMATSVQYFFFYVGLAHTSGVKGSIITGANTLFAILIAAVIFRQERLTVRKMAGCIVGLAGVVVANMGGQGIEMTFSFVGEGFMLISVISGAMASVLIRKYSDKEQPVLLSGYQSLLGGGTLIVIGIVMHGHLQKITPASLGILIYLALLSAVAYGLWSILLKYNPVSRVTIYAFMTPVMGVLLSALLLGEGAQAFRLRNMTALVLVCAGICLVNFAGRRCQNRDRC